MLIALCRRLSLLTGFAVIVMVALGVPRFAHGSAANPSSCPAILLLASSASPDSGGDCGCAYPGPLRWLCRQICPLDLLGQVIAILLLVALLGAVVWVCWTAWDHYRTRDRGYSYYEHTPRREEQPSEPASGTQPSPQSTLSQPAIRLQPQTPLRPEANSGSLPQQPQAQTYQQARKDPPTAEELNRRIDELNDRLSVIHQEASRSLGSAQDIDALIEVLRPFAAEGAVRSGQPQMPDIEELLLSATAFYICGHCKKTDLPAMLADVGVGVSLMLHRNIDRFLADPGATWAEFVPSDQDGCWLWHEQGGGRCLGIPIDTNIFRIPPAPLFLARVCEGVTAGTEFRINGVLRPCHFQQDPDLRRFQLTRKGAVQTQGSQAILPPSGRDFPALTSIIRPPRPAGSGSMAAILRGQAALFRDRILALERGKREFNSFREALGKVEQFYSVIDSRVKAIETRIEQQPRRLEGAPVPSPDPNKDATAAQARSLMAATARIQTMERKLQSLNERFDDLLSAPDKVPESTASTNFPATPPLQIPDITSEESTKVAPPTLGAPVVLPPLNDPIAAKAQPPQRQTMPGARLPDGWRPILAGMIEKADVEPGAHAVAILALAASLRKLDATCPIHLVHAVEIQRRIQIHFADEEEHEIKCRCGVSKPFSFVVCAGEKGAGSLLVLLPAGRYSISNFPAGYSALIAGVGANSFTIQTVDSPTTLQPVPGTDDEYTVSQQMQITQPR